VVARVPNPCAHGGSSGRRTAWRRCRPGGGVGATHEARGDTAL